MSKKAGLICAIVASAAVFCTMPISLKHSATSGVVVSVDQAKAYYGHYRRVARHLPAQLLLSPLLLAVLTEARRIAANIAKLPELLREIAKLPELFRKP